MQSLPAPNAVTCVLVDDHQMVVEALVGMLQQTRRIRVVGTAGSADKAVQVVAQHQPHVIVSEIKLPGRILFDVAPELLERSPGSRILILSNYLADIFIARALKQNLAGYLMKSDTFAELTAAIERVAAGERVYSRAVSERMVVDPATNLPALRHESELASLTSRQLEVLRYLACGQSVKEIAKVMHLSQKSVDSHKYRIMNKLGIHDRVLLARFAIREGLMVP
uniref:Response regulator transcription factor n=1 Tax=Schlesneria paludicola TaxID=360056 RepID=A0A7C2P248_9PLAN